MAGVKDSSELTRRPHTKLAERAQWAHRFFQSGLSQREFATQHRLRLSTLQRWLRQHPAVTAPPAFAEVTLPAWTPRWAAEVVRTDGTVGRLAHDAPAAWLQPLWPSC